MAIKPIYAILAAVIVVAGATTAMVLINNNGEEKDSDSTPEPRDVVIKNSLGEDITVKAPVTSFCTVNTNAAEFFKILGVDNRIVGADSSSAKTLEYIYKDITDIGDYKNPSGEKIVSTGAKYVISQSSSRSLSAATEQALKDNYGITVLRMNFYGETMMQDVQELLKILISEEAEDEFKDYKETYDGIIETVMTKSKTATGDPAFLMFFTSMSATEGTYYNDKSELGKIVTSIHGHNALNDIDFNQGKTVSSKPSKESIFNLDQNNGIDIVFIRGVDGKTAAQAFAVFENSLKPYDTDTMKVVSAKNVYVIHTDIMSGPRDFIGYVCIAEAYGIDTGLDYEKLVSDFNEDYGFEIEYDFIMTQFPTA